MNVPVAIACVTFLVLTAPRPERLAAAAAPPAAAPSRARLPILFERGTGEFVARTSGGRIALRHTDVRVVRRDAQGSARVHGWHLAGARVTAAVDALEPSPTRVNYLVGRDPSTWRRHVPTFQRVTYRAVYPSIDVTYYGGDQGLEFDFVVAPGGDPRQIRLVFDAPVRIDAAGALAAADGAGPVLRAPVAYQLRDGARHPVRSRFVARSATEVAFELGTFDRRQPLVIDPVLAFSTFFGGSASDKGLDLAVNAQGESYLVGSTIGDIPVTPGAYDTVRGAGTEAFVARLSADGSSLLFTTYLGGVAEDAAYGVAVDAGGYVYVTGTTTSADFPSVNAFQPAYRATLCTVRPLPDPRPCTDAFVAKLSPNGASLAYSTFYGGADNDDGVGIAVDAAGQAHVIGSTMSGDLPLKDAFDSTYVPSSCGNEFFSNKCPEVFVAKFSSSGSALEFATYLGDDNDDWPGGIAVDALGRAVVVGWTNSFDFPVMAALQPVKAGGSCGVTPVAAYFCFDAFVTRFNLDGTLDLSTFYGGIGDDYAADLVLAADGSLWVAGSTTSPNLPLRDPLQPQIGGPTPSTGTGCTPVGNLVTIVCSDVFVAKFDANVTELLEATYLGGIDRDSARGIALDTAGRVAIAGQTKSKGFPIHDAWQPEINGGTSACPLLAVTGCEDAFVAVLAPDAGSLAYSTFLGTFGYDEALAIAGAPDGGVLIAGGATGFYPTTAGALRNDFGGEEAFVTKFFAPPAAGMLVTVAGSGLPDRPIVDVQALRTALRTPFDIALLPGGYRYIADAGWHRVLLMTPGNHMLVVAGNGTPGYSGDYVGLAIDAQLNDPRGVAVDAAGNVYIADSGNHVVRMMSAINRVMITIAGTGAAGFGGDGGPATSAPLNYPTDLLVAGNTLYVSDTGNHRVRAITADGTIRTVAGNGVPASNGDGGAATSASLLLPSGLAFDNAARLLIADWGAHVIRRVDAAGVIATIAGTGTPGYSGDGGPAGGAQLNGPYGLEVDASGRVFIADTLNHRVRMIASGGTISTLAGTSTPTASPLLPRPALEAPLSFPTSVALEGGNLLIADSVNKRVGMIHRVAP